MATKERFDAMVLECKALRSAFSDAGVDFMAAVMRFETDEAAWRSGIDGDYGWATFGQALHQTNLLKLHRLETFKRMVEVCGSVEEVRKIGMEAAEELLLIPQNAMSRIVNEPAVDAVKAELVSFREREGKEASGQTAKTIRIKHVPPQPKKEGPKVENAYDRLVRENRELKSRVRELEKENAQLRERLGDEGKPGTARKPKKQGRNGARAEA